MPTFAEQLTEAARLLETKGAEALNNPHAMIGRECHCGQCFCCAALKVYTAYTQARQQAEDRP